MVQILPTSSSKSDPNVIVIVFHFKVRIEFSPQSRALLADLILPKCSSFSTFWNANRALAAVLCWQLSRSRRGTAETETLLWRPRNHFTRKTQGFVPESVTLCFHLSQLLQTCIAGAPHKIERRSRSALLTIGLRPRKSVLLRPPQFFVIFVCEIEFSQQSGSPSLALVRNEGMRWRYARYEILKHHDFTYCNGNDARTLQHKPLRAEIISIKARRGQYLRTDHQSNP